MKTSSKAILALSVVLKVAATTAPGGGLVDTVQRCDYYQQVDRATLQSLLDELLENSPSDECIPYIVDLLGGAPLAEVDSDLTGEGAFTGNTTREDSEFPGRGNGVYDR